MTPSHEMVLRVTAAQATFDHFDGKEHAWGQVDCGRLVAHHLRQFGKKPRLVRFGSYSTPRGALAALRRAGFRSMAEVLDDLRLVAVAPAEALVADILGGDSTDPFGAIGVYLGNGAMLGFAEGVSFATKLRLRAPMARAWRVI